MSASDAQKRLDVIIASQVTGEAELKRYQAEIGELLKQYKELGAQAPKFNDWVNDQKRALRGAARETQNYSAEFKELTKRIDAATKALREQRQASAAAMPTSGAVLDPRNLTDAQAIVAAKDAKSVTAYSEASKTVQQYTRYLDDTGRALKANTDRQTAYFKALQETSRKEAEARSQQVGSRGYLNLSTYTDQLIEQRRQESKAFAASLQARLKEEVANERLSDSSSRLASNLPRLRYALYDVSTTAAFTGAAMLGMGAAVLATGIKMDRQFADVVRTTGVYMKGSAVSAGELREEFEGLFSTLPASWSDLTDIGTLAGQLDVATGSVAEFTSLVTKFSTVTPVAVEDSATAFARLSQLLDVPASQFENLGSSILAVGVNSIATESQIIAISSQIASMGNLAGMSAADVFGLSAALASIGTQPELARGLITRLFTNISTAVSDGGDRLEAFGRTAGVTGQQFATAWGQDATSALQKLLAGLGSLDQSQATQVLSDLGITAARDVPTVLKLAQNTDILAKSLETARQGFDDGTALQEQYGVVADTVAEKLNVLKNNVQLYIDSLQNSDGALGAFVDALTAIVRVLTEMQNNPIMGWLNPLIVGLVALSGVALLAVGGAARLGASFLALRTASVDLRKDLIQDGIALGVLKAEADAASMSTLKLATSVRSAAVASNTASVATMGLTASMRALKIASGVGIALLAVEAAMSAYSWWTLKAKDATAEYNEALAEALRADSTVALSDAINRFSVEVETSNTAMVNNSDAANALIGSQVDLGDATTGTTDDVVTQTVAIDENSDAWVRNELAKRVFGEETDGNKQLEQINTLTAGLERFGITSDQVTAAIESNNQAQLDSWKSLINLENVYDQAIVDRPEGYSKAAVAEAELRLSQGNAVLEFIDTASQLRAEVESTINAMTASGIAADFFGSSLGLLGDSADGTTDSFSLLAEEVEAAMEAISGSMRTTLDLEDSLGGLGQSLAQNGLVWDQYSEAGRSNLTALLKTMDEIAAQTPDDANAIAANMQALFDTLVNGGYASKEQLTVLRNTILSLGGPNVKSSGLEMSSFFNGWAQGATKAAKSSRSAAREVRTLLDYAKDLSGVWGRAFDIRFDSQSTLDKITSSFIDLYEAADESAKKIADLQRTISRLETDLGTQQYFLGIALDYNDTLRAAEIQADIADIQAQLAEAQNQLGEEQAANNKSLVGNTKAAVSNRKVMTSLVSEYQDHIEALAASGVSSQELAVRTAQLKQEFINQATALGFANDEVLVYARAFDDVSAAIARIPANITVAANADPALQALNEFDARQRAVRAAAEAPITYTSDFSKIARGEAIRAQITRAQMLINSTNMPWTAVKGQLDAIDRWNAQLASGNYWTGGYTGRGGRYEPAGTVHRGEYVIPAPMVNQSTGLPKADALGRLIQGAPGGPSFAMGGYVPGRTGRDVVRLDGISIQQIAQAVRPMLMIDNQLISGTAARGNANAMRVGAR